MDLSVTSPIPNHSNTTFTEAFAYCEAIVHKHAKSFYFCAHFLPRHKRMAMFAIYALCRTLDDIVDEPGDKTPLELQTALKEWRGKLDLLYGDGYLTDAILVAMRATLYHYPVAKQLLLDLIAGIEMDLNGYHYKTFADLKLYCYRVAATVGLMSSEVFGYRDKAALPYAEALGIAMQLTNILRDIGEDLRNGRAYLPDEEMAAFNYTIEDLRANRVDNRFIELMKFQIARARGLYQQADEGIKMLSADSRLTALAASRLYGAILDQIERNHYDVFSRRASLSMSAKIARLPGIFLTRWLKFR